VEKSTNRAIYQTGEFDPGSEGTLAAWFRHASRAILHLNLSLTARKGLWDDAKERQKGE